MMCRLLAEFDHRSEFYYMVLSIANDIMYRAFVFSARSVRSSRLDPSSVSTHVHREHSRLIILIDSISSKSFPGKWGVTSQDLGQSSHSMFNFTMPSIRLECSAACTTLRQSQQKFQRHRTSLGTSTHPQLYKFKR